MNGGGGGKKRQKSSHSKCSVLFPNPFHSTSPVFKTGCSGDVDDDDVLLMVSYVLIIN